MARTGWMTAWAARHRDYAGLPVLRQWDERKVRAHLTEHPACFVEQLVEQLRMNEQSGGLPSDMECIYSIERLAWAIWLRRAQDAP